PSANCNADAAPRGACGVAVLPGWMIAQRLEALLQPDPRPGSPVRSQVAFDRAIAKSKFEGIDGQLSRELVYSGLDGKARLLRARRPVGACARLVGENLVSAKLQIGK